MRGFDSGIDGEGCAGDGLDVPCERQLPVPNMTLARIADRPELVQEAAVWFAGKWAISVGEYAEGMAESIERPSAVPQWFVLRDEHAGGAIVAGFGIVDNDFHDRTDLAPNLCALYVEEPYRGRGIARWLLDWASNQARLLGYERLYLVTDHEDLYERCGWEFLGYAREEDGNLIRLYGDGSR